MNLAGDCSRNLQGSRWSCCLSVPCFFLSSETKSLRSQWAEFLPSPTVEAQRRLPSSRPCPHPLVSWKYERKGIIKDQGRYLTEGRAFLAVVHKKPPQTASLLFQLSFLQLSSNKGNSDGPTNVREAPIATWNFFLDPVFWNLNFQRSPQKVLGSNLPPLWMGCWVGGRGSGRSLLQ